MSKKAPKNKSQNTGFLPALVLTVLSGCGVFLSFPNFFEVELFFLQWFALVPLLWVLEGRSVKQSFGWGLWTGFVVNLGGFYWISHLLMDFGHFPLWAAIPVTALNALYQGLVFGFWGAGTAFFRNRFGIPLLFAAPVVFALVENLFPLVFPWYFANGQYLFHPIVQMTEWTGIAGLTWLLVLVNCGLYRGVHAKRHGLPFPRFQVILPLVLLGLALGVGTVRIAEVDVAMEQAEKLRVGMVEANVGIFEKEAKGLGAKAASQALAYNLVKHQRLSAELEKEGVELIVWPESSYIPRWAVLVKSTEGEAVAVGDNGSIYLRMEEGWRAPPLSLPDGVMGNRIRAIWAGDERAVYAVGDGGLVLFYDGMQWKKLKTPTNTNFHAITGFKDSSKGFVALVVGEGGSMLSISPSGKMTEGVMGQGKTLRGVASTGRGRLNIAVGDEGTIVELTSSGWSTVPSPAKKTLRGVWINGNNEAWAVGEEGVFHRTRKGKWEGVQNSPPGLFSVWGRSKGEVYAGGEGGLLIRYDGKAWVTERSGGTGRVTGLGGGPSGRVVAVRSDGVVLERGEQKWVPVEVPGNAHLRAVSALGYRAETWLPHDVTAFYQSEIPLPTATTPKEAALQESRVSNQEKMSPQRGFKTPVLFGAVLHKGTQGDKRFYNSTLLLGEEGRVLGRYDKNHLLVFGEYIPGGELFPQLYEWIPAANHFYAGEGVSTFSFKGYKLGPLVCYEDILPSFTRRVAARGVDALINVTNDAWFGKTAEPYLHLALATFRSVENRKMMVRSTNTGVSAYIDAVGRIVAQTSLDGAETLIYDVPMLREETFYTRYGEVFLALCYGALSLFFLYGFWPSKPALSRRKRKKT